MAIGILESHYSERPPGTVLLADDSARVETLESTLSHSLKHGTGKNAHIVLVPQPSDDPNDPLNWSLLYRDTLVLAFIFCTFTFAAAIGPLLTPFAFNLVQEYKVSFTKVSLLTGWQLLTVGIICLVVSPLTRKFGKRPVMVVTGIMGLGGCIWLVYADTYNTTLGARVLQGLAVAFYEAIGFSMIADLYCVHERGTRIAAYLFPLGAFNVLAPLLTGVVAVNLGVLWVFRLMAIFAGVALAVVIFFIPETAFNRSSIYNIDEIAVEKLGQITQSKMEAGGHIETTSIEISQPTVTNHVKKSHWQLLWTYQGPFTEKSLFQLTLAPWKLVLNPAVLWSCMIQGGVSAWTVAVSFVLAQIFAVPPYNYNPAQVGYLYTGALVGGLIAEVLCIMSNDRLAKYFARLNGGVYEPEFRLWLIIPMVIMGIIGFFGFGASIENGNGPIVASMFYGFITASLMFSHVGSGSYITDAFRNHSVETFTVVVVFKNLLFFIFSLFINNWLSRDGPRRVFNVIGGVQIVVAFLTVPLYILGKKNRSLMGRWKLMN